MTARRRASLRLIALSLAPGLLIAGCTPPSRSLYGAGDVGVMIDTTEATVVSSRPVEIESGPTAVGPVAGGVSAGTVAAALLGGGGLATLAAVLGGLAGAGAGYAAERELRSGDGVEYVIETADGRTVTIVQRADEEPPIPDGTLVLMQMSGGYSRLIEHPSADADASDENWIDPDAPAATLSPPSAGEVAPPSPPQQQ